MAEPRYDCIEDFYKGAGTLLQPSVRRTGSPKTRHTASHE